MKDREILDHVELALAVVISLGAFAGSANELIRIAERANYGLPLGVVAALDGLAVLCVVRLSRRTDWQAWACLIMATLSSIGLQVLEVPRDQAWDLLVAAVACHALVPLASFAAVHISTNRHDPEAVPEQPGTAVPGPALTGPREVARELVPGPVGEVVPTGPTDGPEVVPGPARKTTADRPRTTKRTTQTLQTVPLDELVPVAEKVAADLAARGTSLSRRTLAEGVRAAGYTCGTTKADELLKRLQRPPLALVSADGEAAR